MPQCSVSCSDSNWYESAGSPITVWITLTYEYELDPANKKVHMAMKADFDASPYAYYSGNGIEFQLLCWQTATQSSVASQTWRDRLYNNGSRASLPTTAVNREQWWTFDVDMYASDGNVNLLVPQVALRGRTLWPMSEQAAIANARYPYKVYPMDVPDDNIGDGEYYKLRTDPNDFSGIDNPSPWRYYNESYFEDGIVINAAPPRIYSISKIDATSARVSYNTMYGAHGGVPLAVAASESYAAQGGDTWQTVFDRCHSFALPTTPSTGTFDIDEVDNGGMTHAPKMAFLGVQGHDNQYNDSNWVLFLPQPLTPTNVSVKASGDYGATFSWENPQAWAGDSGKPNNGGFTDYTIEIYEGAVTVDSKGDISNPGSVKRLASIGWNNVSYTINNVWSADEGRTQKTFTILARSSYEQWNNTQKLQFCKNPHDNGNPLYVDGVYSKPSSTMTLTNGKNKDVVWVYDNGSWHRGTEVYVYNNGWKKASSISVYNNGWKTVNL